MSAVWLLVALVAAQRLAELAYANRNTRRLLARGAVETGAGHYPVIAGLHVAWLAAIVIQVPPDTPIQWPWLWAYVAVEGLRAWTMASLGRYWTTRIITLPGAPLVRRGPYRWVRHPNYMIVAAEIAILPLVFGAWLIALVFSMLNACVLAVRIRAENRALAERPDAAP